MTATADNYRKNIISKLKELPAEKLPLVDTYLDSLTDKKKKAAILAYAGIFNDLDEETMNSLTVDLLKERVSLTSDLFKN